MVQFTGVCMMNFPSTTLNFRCVFSRVWIGLVLGILLLACSGAGTDMDAGLDDGTEDGADEQEDRTGLVCAEDGECPGGWCQWNTLHHELLCSKACGEASPCPEGSDQEPGFCCVLDEAGDGFCEKLLEGFVCGEQDGACGVDCWGQGQSACLPGYLCATEGNPTSFAFCSMPCEEDLDCRGCEVERSPDAEVGCWPISGGARYCLIM